ncbi:MAG: T9SS type A sorting domain-containing protein [Bacteroidetes bacterium]|nr:T9SS type A sorting domain-containing protein [Bacteroidota bacterium]
MLLIILSPVSLQAQSTTALSFSAIPMSDPDIVAPFRGTEKWHDLDASDRIDYPVQGGHQEPGDAYYRSGISWNVLETSQGVYNWSMIDRLINACIDKNQKFNFNVMTLHPGSNDGIYTGGANMKYPMYVHNQMQADGGNNTDWIKNGQWVPNWNSNFFLTRVEALLSAMASHFNSTTYKGVSYANVIGYVDIGIFGSWGEWNHSSIINSPSEFPTGRQATAASLNRIIDAHIKAFPNYPLIANMHVFDGNQFANVQVPPATGYYALTVSNAWGKLGVKRMNWGRGWEYYVLASTLNNPTVYNGLRFGTEISERWKYAPINGEGPCYTTAEGGNAPFWNLMNEVLTNHMSSLGNGNFCGEQYNAAGVANLRAALKMAGYRVVVESGSMTTDVKTNQTTNITLNWKNIGNAPVYEFWDVMYELQNQSTNAVVWSTKSSHNLRFWLPQSAATQVSDNFTIPSSVPAGTYKMVLKVVDPKGYRRPLPLAITGRLTDGGYLLRSNIAVTAGNANATTVTVNAGADQNLSSGTTQATLTGTLTGTATTTWSKVSGPTGETISSAANLSTSVTGLTAGTYVFRLSATASGTTTTDDITVVVAAANANAAPTANAGNNIIITLPASIANFSGSGTDTDGSIRSYAWFQVSGPNTARFGASNAASTSVSGLAQGIYVFRLTVTDDDGATATDDITVTVNAAAQTTDSNTTTPPTVAPVANNAPSVNAGDNRSITLPTNSVTLTGTATDSDGSISKWAWTLVSGTGGTINPSNTATTTVSGLSAGTYTFRLTVTDDDGATAYDDVTIFVNQASNKPPVANAGANFSTTVGATINLNGSASTDPDGTLTAYQWKQVSGPNTASFDQLRQVRVNVSNLVAGTYIFNLTVTDDRGAISSANVTVTVTAPQNSAPIIITEDTVKVNLPASGVELNADQSYDPDGKVIYYRWETLSAPNLPSIANDTASIATLNSLVEGTYTIRLTATDATGNKTQKNVIVIVANPDAQTLKLYPNPATTMLNIQLNSKLTGKTQIRLYNMSGIMVHNEEFQKSADVVTKTINVSGLTSGTYVLTIRTEDAEVVTKKVQKIQ